MIIRQKRKLELMIIQYQVCKLLNTSTLLCKDFYAYKSGKPPTGTYNYENLMQNMGKSSQARTRKRKQRHGNFFPLLEFFHN